MRFNAAALILTSRMGIGATIGGARQAAQAQRDQVSRDGVVCLRAGMTCTVVIKEGAGPQIGLGIKKAMAALF
jgi:hypothetical protein